MTIRDEARQEAAQEYTQRHIGGMQPVETIGDRVRAAFEAGAIWASEHPDREPSGDYPDAEGLAALRANREPSDEWCREEGCQYRRWHSGSAPTHRRGAGCLGPSQDTGEQGS